MSILAHDMTVSIRELQRNAARIMKDVEAGMTVIVTRRGQEVGRLVPPDPAEAALRAAVASGAIDAEALKNLWTGAQTAAMAEHRTPYTSDGPTASEILARMRDEERY